MVGFSSFRQRLVLVCILFGYVPVVLALWCNLVSASEVKPIVESIDRFVQQGYQQRGIEPATVGDDRGFVRRLYLDLVGRVPTVDELDQFLEVDAEKRRPQLIDELLGRDEHIVHLADMFDTLLMGRADEGKYNQRVQHHWRTFLENSLRQNQPWNEFVEEILLARPKADAKRGANWFLFERNDNYQEIAESVAPAIFGIRVECAQCHDHMLVDEIKQAHYWGLVAFFNRGKNELKNAGPQIAESAIGGFSEFANLTGDSTPNVLTFLEAEPIHEDRPSKDEKREDLDENYRPGVAESTPRIPKFSRREKFVTGVVRDHPRVSLALVNRVWALLMGRGIVHPFDEMDSMHPPSHPELLDWLALDFRKHGCNVRRLIRGIVSSNTYQLASRRPEGVEDPASFAWYLERPLTGEQLARSAQMALRGECANGSALVGAFRQQFPDLLPDVNTAQIKEALFLSNDQRVQSLLVSSDQATHLIPRLINVAGNQERVEVLFQTMFGRSPEAEELSAVVDYLETRGGSVDAIRQVAWSMLTSAEFRYNH